MRLDYKAELEDNKAAWHYFRTKYPLLFEGMESSYFHLPKGWRKLCESVFAFLNKEGVKVVQVKQKFGELRIYTEEVCTGECDRLIKMAEALARATCEFCGSTEDVTLFEVGYVSRTCRSCKTMLCESTLMYWILNGRGRELKDSQWYCVQELRKLNEVSRVAGQDS